MAQAKSESNAAKLRQRAAERLAQNDLPQAIRDFEELLKLMPDDADARCGYALALSRSSRIDEAARALRVDPTRVERLRANLKANADLNVGVAIYSESDVADADFPPELLTSLITLPRTNFYTLAARTAATACGFADHRMSAPPVNAQQPHSLTNVADACKDFADTVAAVSLLNLVITVDNTVAHLAGALAKPVWLLLHHANAWPWTNGRDEAPRYATMRIFRQPRKGDWPSVVNAVRHALNREITIRNAPASEWNNLAGTLITQSRFPEAEAAARRALGREPNNANALLNLAVALHQQNRIEDAIAHYEQALTQKPDWPLALSNLSDAYARVARMEDAETAARRAVALDPNSAAFHANLAAVLVRRGRADEAADSANQALALNPNDPRAHVNLAAALFGLNRYEEAWPHHEWRPLARTVTNPTRKLWTGEDLKNQSITLRAEQGIGDTIMFVRYASLLKKIGASAVIVECPPALKDLLATATEVDEVRESNLAVPLAGRSPASRYEIAMMSLPHRFNTTPKTIPAQVPYILADNDRIERLKPRVRGSAKYKIGLIWSGNPTQGNNRQRSIPLTTLAPLAALKNTNLYSLQKSDPADRDRGIADQLNIIDLAAHCDDLADLAAAMSLLDLIITTDTGPAHVAGALGLPTWLLLSSAPDWRWMQNRADSPWYPSMRLFRQRQPFDWETVVAEVVAALADRLQSHPT